MNVHSGNTKLNCPESDKNAKLKHPKRGALELRNPRKLILRVEEESLIQSQAPLFGNRKCMVVSFSSRTSK